MSRGEVGCPVAVLLTPVPCPQILTQEDWNKVLYNGMASTSSWAALYFIALMTFGNYVLFNLLVAILVEGFQAEVTPCPVYLTLLRDASFFLPPLLTMRPESSCRQ